MQIPIYILFIMLNVGIAWLHNQLRIRAIKNGKKAISHGWWAMIYAGICAIPIYWFPDWCFYIALGLLHLSVFPVAFNLYSRIPAFHLSQTSTAITDRLMVRIGLKDTETVNVIAQLLSIGLLTWSIIYS